MKDTAEAIKPDKKSLTWLAYMDYVNGLVIQEPIFEMKFDPYNVFGSS